MGTPAFSVPVLAALTDAGHRVVGVYTRPDRPTGRGRAMSAPEVKRYAQDNGLPVFQPASLRRDTAATDELRSLSADVLVVAAYGLFLPKAAFAGPALGALNVHPSLLPKYRGPSPVASAILSGDNATGVTIMQVDEGMDSGPIVAQRQSAIGHHETAEELTLRLFQEGGSLLVEVLPRWARGDIEAHAQDEGAVTTTSRLQREDGRIDWSDPAAEIALQVRAFHPWPGSHTSWRGRSLKIVAANGWEGSEHPPATPGEVVSLADGGVGAGTGLGLLQLRRVQLEGRRVVDVLEFVQGHRDFVGSRLGEQMR